MECHICNMFKNLNDFYKRKDNRKTEGYRYTRPCKECTKKRSKINSNSKTLDEKRDKWNSWRNKNKEKVNEYCRNYRKENPNILNKINTKYKNSKKFDIQFNISNSIRKKIRYYLIENVKINRYISFMQCDTIFARKWIEFQFIKNMSWSNYGNYWSFDHIIPLDKFNLEDEEEFKLCNKWSNLQPLQKSNNCGKKNKIFSDIVNTKFCKSIIFEIIMTVLEES